MNKALLALAIAMATFSSLTQAQPPQAQDNPLRQAVVASWHLDAEKSRALAEADAQFRAQREGLGDAASPQQRRQAMEELLEQQRTRLAPILDAEQLHAYLMLERPPAGPHRPVRERIDAQRLAEDFEQRFTGLLESWKLDPASRQRVFGAQRTFIAGIEELKAQRPGAQRRSDRGEALERLLARRHEALAEVLDAEQLAAFEALTRPPHRGQGGPAGEPTPDRG